MAARAFVGFLVPCADASESLDLAEEVLDQMAPFVLLAIIVDKLGGAFALRNDRLDPILCQTRAQRLGVKGLVAEEGFAVDTLQQIIDRLDVVTRHRPGNKVKRTKFPSASTKAAILVVKPPRERPIA